MNRVIGLMGNSGSGKTTVAEYLKELGAYVIDADQISRELSEAGQPANRAVREAFGEAFFHSDGSMDRRRLGEYAFANPGELRRLEGIIHPLVLEEVERRMADPPSDTVVIDCALLVQAGLHRLADEVWLVETPYGEKIERIQKRDGIGAQHAANRLQNQQAESELERYADHVIRNTGTLDELRKQVGKLYHE